MKEIGVLLFSIVSGVLLATARTIVTIPCTDSGVWIDGHVSCTYLEKQSGYGIHNNQAGFCQKYHKECCLTCTRLKQKGFNKVASKPSTATVSVTRTSVPTTQAQQKSTLESSCTDSGVWMLDGKVSCEYLERPSGYGIHNDQRRFCQNHYKECCRMCNKLEKNGYTTGAGSVTTSVETTTTHPVSTGSTTTIRGMTTSVSCTDSGVWMVDGKVSCQYLSAYGIHRSPAKFCQNYHKECCKTCTRLKQSGYTILDPVTTQTISTTTPSTDHHTTTADPKPTYSPCKDSGVWMLDGIVGCEYLEKQSGYGLHKNPKVACQKYQKECCETCTRLHQNGYTTSSAVSATPTSVTTQTVPTIVMTADHTSTTQSVPTIVMTADHTSTTQSVPTIVMTADHTSTTQNVPTIVMTDDHTSTTQSVPTIVMTADHTSTTQSVPTIVMTDDHTSTTASSISKYSVKENTSKRLSDHVMDISRKVFKGVKHFLPKKWCIFCATE